MAPPVSSRVAALALSSLALLVSALVVRRLTRVPSAGAAAAAPAVHEEAKSDFKLLGFFVDEKVSFIFDEVEYQHAIVGMKNQTVINPRTKKSCGTWNAELRKIEFNEEEDAKRHEEDKL